MTVNLEDRSGSLPDVAISEDEVEEPRLGGTDIFRGGLVIGLAMLIGGFVMLRGLTQDSTTESDTTEAATDQNVGADDSATSTTGGVDGQVEGGAEDGTTGSIAADGALPADGESMMEADATDPSAEAGDGAMVDGVMVDGVMVDGANGGEEVASPTLRSPAEVRVLVLNGAAQRQGVAARGTEVLKAASYNTAAPKNADKTTPQSLILYLEGYQAEAQAVANAFGPELTGIVQPYDPLLPPIGDIQSANVIVIIGEDDIIPVS